MAVKSNATKNTTFWSRVVGFIGRGSLASKIHSQNAPAAIYIPPHRTGVTSLKYEVGVRKQEDGIRTVGFSQVSVVAQWCELEYNDR